MKIQEIILCLLVLGTNPCLYGQDYSPQSFPVIEYDKTLSYPFAGGLDAPQFYTLDANLDGEDELIVFDRPSGQWLIFRKNGTNYMYDPDLEAIFPSASDWVILRDYNGDGIKDVFTSPKGTTQTTVAVYKAIIRNGMLRYERLFFPNEPRDVLNYEWFGQQYGVYVAKIDVPGIMDVDDDGDMDVLSFESGGGTVNFYRNLCKEENLPLDEFKLELADRCWGKFRESLFDEVIVLSDDPNQCADAGSFRHAGSAINLLDKDGDGDLDLLLGDSDYSGLIYLENAGGSSDYMFAQERDFPQADVPVSLRWFLSSYLLDANGDGQEDLVVAPNTATGAENADHCWLYIDHNAGPPYDFRWERSDFLIDQMIDWGSQIYPCFCDPNGDGKIDLLLGGSGIVDFEGNLRSRIILYENQGSATEPVFVLTDTDFLALSTTGEAFLAPATGDLDGDGDMDVLIGMGNGQMQFYENLAGPGNPWHLADPDRAFMNIDVGFNALPAIYDIDGDGLGDIITGNALSFSQNGVTGSLALFGNTGQVGTPHFNPDFQATSNQIPWSDIRLHENFFNLSSFVRPVFSESKNGLIMTTGSIRGTINLYRVNGMDQVELLIDSLKHFDFGEFSAPALADVDGDSFLDLFVGTGTGGVRCYRTDLKTSVTGIATQINENPKIRLSPNPADARVHIQVNGIDRATGIILLIDPMGNIAYQDDWDNIDCVLDVRSLAAGLYSVCIFSGNSCLNSRLFIHPKKE